jgi:hypothetical protein
MNTIGNDYETDYPEEQPKRKDPAAVALGRKGGQSRSPAKLAAMRESLKKAWAARREKAAARRQLPPA